MWSLTRSAPVIPSVQGGTRMAGASALLEKLWSLAWLNAIDLSDSRWEPDRDRLFATREALTPLKPSCHAGVVSVGSVCKSSQRRGQRHGRR